MLVYIQSIIALVLGGISAITDFKDKKIYNKNICLFICASICTYILFYETINIENIRYYLINFIISFIISFTFFYFKIWAAGDAKLFLAIVFMIPYEVYKTSNLNVFPAFWLLVIIFTIAFIYVIFETIILWIKDKQRFEKLKFKKFSKDKFIDSILYYFMGYFLVSIINNLIYHFFEEFAVNNASSLMLCNMLFLLFIYRIVNKKSHIFVITFLSIISNIVYYCVNGIEIHSIDLKLLFIVLLIMVFRSISEKYNYEEINISELKPRMILSYASVIRFCTSRIKGLPSTTTENTDSRLTEEQVESIKRWSKSKKGSNTIVIVRHLPFAPFIFIGEFIFFIIKIFI